MASLQILGPTISSVSFSQSYFARKPGWTFPESYFQKRILKLQTFSGATSSIKFKVFCRAQETENQNNGEEPPESLFMKELKKRGMTPHSLLEDYKQSNYVMDEEMKLNEDTGFRNRNAVSTDVQKGLENQREKSMALNSEGLEGLVPRAKLLLTTGGTFFLGFGPLILITIAFFSALCFYFGPSFVHDAGKMSLSPPQYVDPYALLEDERISQIAPQLN